MTTLRAAIGATFGTVTTTASAVNSVAVSIDEGAGALADYAKQLRKKQRVQYAMDELSYEKNAVLKAAERDLRASEELDKYLDADEGRRARFEKIFSDYSAAIAATKSA